MKFRMLTPAEVALQETMNRWDETEWFSFLVGERVAQSYEDMVVYGWPWTWPFGLEGGYNLL